MTIRQIASDTERSKLPNKAVEDGSAITCGFCESDEMYRFKGKRGLGTSIGKEITADKPIIINRNLQSFNFRYMAKNYYGGKERKYMKGKIKYTDEPMGKVKVVSDFLPSPEELALKDETVKVTIALSKTSVDFFKKEAKKYNTQYQKMIRRLLDEYSAHQ